MIRTIGLIVAAFAGAVAFAAPAVARPARCDIRVAGFASYHGACDFHVEPGGSFTASRPGALLLRADPSSAYGDNDSVKMKLLTPEIALLFGIGGAHQTGTYLATLYRQGACWISRPPKDEIDGDASVCVR